MTVLACYDNCSVLIPYASFDHTCTCTCTRIGTVSHQCGMQITAHSTVYCRCILCILKKLALSILFTLVMHQMHINAVLVQGNKLFDAGRSRYG